MNDKPSQELDRSTGSASVACLWENLTEGVRAAIEKKGAVSEMARHKQPLCIIVPPGTVESSMFPCDMLAALTTAYEVKRFVYDVPERGWKIRIYGDRVKSSL